MWASRRAKTFNFVARGQPRNSVSPPTHSTIRQPISAHHAEERLAADERGDGDDREQRAEAERDARPARGAR